MSIRKGHSSPPKRCLKFSVSSLTARRIKSVPTSNRVTRKKFHTIIPLKCTTSNALTDKARIYPNRPSKNVVFEFLSRMYSKFACLQTEKSGERYATFTSNLM